MPTRSRRSARAPLLALVALLAVALVAPGAASAASPTKAADATLLRYASDTWASFVAMVDPESRAPGRQPVLGRVDERPDLGHEHRRLHVEHPRRGPARLHRPRRGRRSPGGDAGLARDDGDPRAERAVLQLVRPPHGRQAHGLAADRRAPDAHPVLRRQRLARDRPARDRVDASPRSRIAPRPCSTAWTSGSTTGPRSTGSRSTSRPTRASRRAATTPSSARAGSPPTSASPRASCPRRSTSAPGGPSPTPATGAGRRPSRWA